VNGFESILSQDQPIQTLTRFLQKGKIPHALLFTGIDGVGKRLTALAFAMACNCVGIRSDPLPHAGNSPRENGCSHEDNAVATGPCGICSACNKIRSKNHPDLLIVEPSGAMIKIRQMRDLFRTLALKPYEARVRVVIITESHTMNPAAANALLKVLEEPPDRTVLILTARQTSDLLPTIVSRCRHIRFNPISQQHIRLLLEKRHGIDSDHAEILSTMANGSFTRALSMSRSNWINHRKWLISAGGLEAPEMLSKRPKSLLLAYSEKLAKNKELVLESLDMISVWFRDLVVWKYKPENIINKDLTEKIQYASQKNTVDDLLNKIKAVEQAKRDIQANLNLRLSLDVLMMRLAKGNVLQRPHSVDPEMR